MDKITSYMRVTKKRKAQHDEAATKLKAVGGSRAVAKEKPVQEEEEGGEEEYVPEFIYKVRLWTPITLVGL